MGHDLLQALTRSKFGAGQNVLRAGFEPATYGCLLLLYSPPLYQLSYQRIESVNGFCRCQFSTGTDVVPEVKVTKHDTGFVRLLTA